MFCGRYVNRSNVPESGTVDARDDGVWWQWASPGKRRETPDDPAATVDVAAASETKALAAKLRPNFKCDR